VVDAGCGLWKRNGKGGCVGHKVDESHVSWYRDLGPEVDVITVDVQSKRGEVGWSWGFVVGEIMIFLSPPRTQSSLLVGLDPVNGGWPVAISIVRIW